MHFWRDASEGQRLTQAWNKEFPVPVAPDVLTSSNPSSPKKTSAKVTQLTQDSIDNPEDEDPAKLSDEKKPKDKQDTSKEDLGDNVPIHSELSDEVNC